MARSRYSSKKILIPAILLGAALVIALWISSVNAGQETTGTIQTNIEISAKQPQFDNASDYFIFSSQKELFSGIEAEFNSNQQNDNADTADGATISTEQRRQLAEEGLKSISSPSERPAMASVKDYSVPGPD